MNDFTSAGSKLITWTPEDTSECCRKTSRACLMQLWACLRHCPYRVYGTQVTMQFN